jgi:hypothetical protein
MTVKRGQRATATSESEVGFTVTNAGTSACELQGYPTLTLLGPKGPIASSAATFGPTPSQLTLAPKASGGFVMEYVAAGGITTCGETQSAHVVGVKVLLAAARGSAVEAKGGFYMCPANAPTIKLSAVLSYAEYQELLRVTDDSQATTTTTTS